MNCDQCRDSLVACVEGALAEGEVLLCRTHLESCAECRTEFAAVSRLHHRLDARGRAVASVSVVEPVMRRVLHDQTRPASKQIRARVFARWGLGLGAAAAVAAVVLMIVLAIPAAKANAAEMLARGARAATNLSSIHILGKLRTPPADNFSAIAPDQDFVSVELWKQLGGVPKWRIDKPGRMAVMNGQSTLLYFKTNNVGMKHERPARSAFDTEWLHELANVARMLASERTAIRMPGSTVEFTQQTGADGTKKSVVTIESRSNLLAGDYLKNKFFSTADTRRVYVFDTPSDRLEAMQIYLVAQAAPQLIFEVTQIDYDQAIDPAVFDPKLPEDVTWMQEGVPVLPDNEKYVAMTAEQAARALFEAFGRRDWEEAAKFWLMPLDDRIKGHLGGLEIVSIGQAFTSAFSTGSFVPYEVKLSNGETRKHNLALKRDRGSNRWYVDGGL